VTLRRTAVERWGAVLTFAVAAAVATACSWTAAAGGPILQTRWRLLVVLAVWGVAWLVAVTVVFRLPVRLGLGLVVAATIVVRVAALAGPPTTSDDLYRYAWDGRVQASGVDPYAHDPLSPELAGLRDDWLWPGARGCADLGRPPGCTRLNRPAERTIYPPVAEAWFGAVHDVTGDGARHKPWQLAGMATDLACVGLLALGLRRWGRDQRWLAVYALCPAPVFEFVHNGHVDGLAVVLLLGAFVIAIPRSGKPVALPTAARDVAVGLLIGAAALVKLYPALVLVAVVALPRVRQWRSLARAAGAAAALAVLAYLPHVLAVGTRVLGYLPGYLREEHYDRGGRFLLAGVIGLGGTTAMVASASVVAMGVAWVVWRRPAAPRAAAVLLVVLLLATTPVQPWYAVSALALACLAAWPAAAVVAAAAYPYYFAVILDLPHATALGGLCYLCTAVAVVTPSVWRRRTEVGTTFAVGSPIPVEGKT
jgi:hypothetical protein